MKSLTNIHVYKGMSMRETLEITSIMIIRAVYTAPVCTCDSFVDYNGGRLVWSYLFTRSDTVDVYAFANLAN